MKQLSILRHAKSSWALPGLDDKSRTLNERGVKQVGILSGWMKQASFSADHVICSSSARTQETLDGLSSAIDTSKASITDDLYLTSLDAYLDVIWSAPACDSLLIVGHNPTCDELVRYLSHSNSPAMETLLMHHFSTGTMAIMNLDIGDWGEVSRAKGRLTHFLRPKLILEGAY